MWDVQFQRKHKTGIQTSDVLASRPYYTPYGADWPHHINLCPIRFDFFFGRRESLHTIVNSRCNFISAWYPPHLQLPAL